MLPALEKCYQHLKSASATQEVLQALKNSYQHLARVQEVQPALKTSIYIITKQIGATFGAKQNRRVLQIIAFCGKHGIIIEQLNNYLPIVGQGGAGRNI